jgi:hypothetical protein
MSDAAAVVAASVVDGACAADLFEREEWEAKLDGAQPDLSLAAGTGSSR